MDFSAGILVTTLLMVLIMEMGDKTQLLVIALTSKYRPIQVFIGISLAILLLNVLAVALGAVIGGIKIIQDCVRAGASLLFVFFGVLSLKEEPPDEEKNRNNKTGAVITIALAFFLAEFGDKTQLSTFSFAALYPSSPVSVFLGSTLGLIAADCVGLIAGAIVAKYISKRTMALISAVLFIGFGLMNGWTTLTMHFLLDEEISMLIMGGVAFLAAASSCLLLLSQRNRS